MISIVSKYLYVIDVSCRGVDINKKYFGLCQIPPLQDDGEVFFMSKN